MFGEYVDAARLALTCQTCGEVWAASVPLLAPIAPAMALVIVAATVLLLVKHGKIAIANPFAPVGQWVKGWPGIRTLVRRSEERVMRKERSEERADELEDELVEFIESKRAATLWTDLECDVEYLRLSRRFPIFKRAVDNTLGARKAIADERVKLKEKATKGGARREITCTVRTKTA